jgi:hypothetical protein
VFELGLVEQQYIEWFLGVEPMEGKIQPLVP